MTSPNPPAPILVDPLRSCSVSLESRVDVAWASERALRRGMLLARFARAERTFLLVLSLIVPADDNDAESDMVVDAGRESPATCLTNHEPGTKAT